VFLILGGIVGGVFAALNSIIGPRRAAAHKQDPYECGLPSEVKLGMRFGISFYLIAMLFILFDIEVVFLYPIAVELKAYGTFALLAVLSPWLYAPADRRGRLAWFTGATLVAGALAVRAYMTGT